MITNTNLYGNTTNKGMGGLVSGMDTDTLVEQMLAGTKGKINAQYQKQQKLVYKQEAYRNIIDKTLLFKDKFFSSSTTNNITNASFFRAYSYESSSKNVSVSGDAERMKNIKILGVESVASAAKFVGADRISTGLFGAQDLGEVTSNIAGDTLTIQYNEGSATKSVTLTIDKDFGRDGNMGADDVVAQLNKQLQKAQLNEKLEYEAVNGSLVLKRLTPSMGSTKITAVSNDIKEALGIEVGSDGASNKAIDADDLKLGLAEVFGGKDAYIKFDFNNQVRTISFTEESIKETLGNDGKIHNYEELRNYLQEKLNKEFGENKVSVVFQKAVDNDGNLTGKYNLTFEADDENDLFGITSLSKDITNLTGIENTTYNRVARNKAIEDAGLSNNHGTLTQGDLGDGKTGYTLKVNGKLFEFETGVSLNTIIKTINNDEDAKVTIYHSSTTDTFTITSDETGQQSKVEIEDVSGNLSKILFGMNDDGTKIGKGTFENGKDTKMKVSINGTEVNINRSSASVVIDDVNITLSDGIVKEFADNGAGYEVTFSATNDVDSVVEKMKDFISQYNELVDLLNTEVKTKPNSDYQPLTPDQEEEMESKDIEKWEKLAKEGMLFGDSLTNGLLNDLRDAMSGFVSGTDLIASKVGISSGYMDSTGKLELDEEAFRKALSEDFEGVVQLFTGEGVRATNRDGSYKTDSDGNFIMEKQGLGVALFGVIKANVGEFGTSGLLVDEAGVKGTLSEYTNNIKESIDDYDDTLKDLKDKMKTERERYWNKFVQLEKAISNLNSQSSWLTQQFGSSY